MFPPDPPHPERTRPIGSFADPAAGTVPTLAVRIGAKIFDLLIQGIPGAVLSAVFVDWGDGDVVAMIKDLKLGGTSQVLKKGTKSKPIRLVDGDHEISCKMDGLAIALKAMYVKKVTG